MSEPMRVQGRYETIIQAYSDAYAPPDEPVLRVNVVGDLVLLELCKYEEATDVTTVTRLQGIDVPLHDLLRAIWPGSMRTTLIAESQSAGGDE